MSPGIMGTNIIHRLIPLRTFRHLAGYNNVDDNVNLLQACYENPLFEEDGAIINETQTKIHKPDGIRAKPYDLNNAAQTSVHFKQSKPKKRRLYIFGAVIAVLAIVAISVAVIVGQRGKLQVSSFLSSYPFFKRLQNTYLAIVFMFLLVNAFGHHLKLSFYSKIK